jgi:hypothetical protein
LGSNYSEGRRDRNSLSEEFDGRSANSQRPVPLDEEGHDGMVGKIKAKPVLWRANTHIKAVMRAELPLMRPVARR